MACTGLEFCKLAIVETKARGMALVDELEKRIGDLDVPLTININGCPNACARTQIADIGLKGMIVTDDNGAAGRGLPGAPGRRPRPGRRVRPEGPRTQGHRRRSGRLRRAGHQATSTPSATPASGSPSGWPAPTKGALL